MIVCVSTAMLLSRSVPTSVSMSVLITWTLTLTRALTLTKRWACLIENVNIGYRTAPILGCSDIWIDLNEILSPVLYRNRRFVVRQNFLRCRSQNQNMDLGYSRHKFQCAVPAYENMRDSFLLKNFAWSNILERLWCRRWCWKWVHAAWPLPKSRLIQHPLSTTQLGCLGGLPCCRLGLAWLSLACLDLNVNPKS
jgi:hypothetical protein